MPKRKFEEISGIDQQNEPEYKRRKIEFKDICTCLNKCVQKYRLHSHSSYELPLTTS